HVEALLQHDDVALEVRDAFGLPGGARHRRDAQDLYRILRHEVAGQAQDAAVVEVAEILLESFLRVEVVLAEHETTRRIQREGVDQAELDDVELLVDAREAAARLV